MIRVQYIGEDKGTVTWEYAPGRSIRLGDNSMFRYADLTQEEYDWLSERAPIRAVPRFDEPTAPDPLQPIVTADDVMTDDTGAVRPRRGRPSTQAIRPMAQSTTQQIDRISIYSPPACVICDDRAITTAGQYPVCNKHYYEYQEEGRKGLPDSQRKVWQKIQEAGNQ